MLTSLPSSTSQAPVATVWPDFNPMDLLSIFEPAQQITMVPRPEQLAITRYLQQVSTKMGSGARLILMPEQATPDILDHQWRLPEAAGKTALLTDICQLVQLYADLLDCPQVGVRLELLTHAMCPKFHIDRTGIRLLCTYIGPGTEWLEEEFCNRAALKHPHATLEAFHSELILHPQGLRQTSQHALVLLKGSRWQGNDHAGVIHRSPEMQPDTTRVVLALDAIW